MIKCNLTVILAANKKTVSARFDGKSTIFNRRNDFEFLERQIKSDFPSFKVKERGENKDVVMYHDTFFRAIIANGCFEGSLTKFLYKDSAIIPPCRTHKNGDLSTEIVYLSKNDFSLTNRVPDPCEEFGFGILSSGFDTIQAQLVKNKHFIVTSYFYGDSFTNYDESLLGVYDLNEKGKVEKLLAREAVKRAINIMFFSAGRQTDLLDYSGERGYGQAYVLDLSKEDPRNIKKFIKESLRRSNKSFEP